MKIGYILRYFPKISESFVLNEINELGRLGHDLYIFALSPAPEDRIPSVPGKGTAYREVHYLPPLSVMQKAVSGFKAYSRSGLFRTEYKAESALLPFALGYFSNLVRRKNIQLLHAHFNGFPTQLAMLISEKTEIPFTFMPHAFDIFKDLDKKLLEKRIEASSFIFAHSKFMKDYIYSLLPGYEEKIRLVRACPDLRRIDETISRRGFEKEKSGPHIITVARLVEKKGIRNALSALSKIKNEYPALRYTIIGKGPCGHELRRKTVESGLKDAVEFIPWLENSEVLERVIRADIFCLPSVRTESGDMDGIPVALMEAMALGTCVISTRLSAIPELIESGREGLLVASGNIEELAGAFRTLLGDIGLRDTLVENAMKKVRRDFDISEQIEKMLVCWRKIAG